MARDPVCGRDLEERLIDSGVGRVVGGAPETDPSHGTKSLYGGRWIYFCSMACRQRFIANPRAYLPTEQTQT